MIELIVLYSIIDIAMIVSLFGIYYADTETVETNYFMFFVLVLLLVLLCI